jgi:hypothetical protein
MGWKRNLRKGKKEMCFGQMPLASMVRKSYFMNMM